MVVCINRQTCWDSKMMLLVSLFVQAVCVDTFYCYYLLQPKLKMGNLDEYTSVLWHTIVDGYRCHDLICLHSTVIICYNRSQGWEILMNIPVFSDIQLWTGTGVITWSHDLICPSDFDLYVHRLQQWDYS